jgi:hypothetical protein
MFKKDKTYKITYTLELGDREEALTAKVIAFEAPLLRVHSESFGEKVFNTSAPSFMMAELVE